MPGGRRGLAPAARRVAELSGDAQHGTDSVRRGGRPVPPPRLRRRDPRRQRRRALPLRLHRGGRDHAPDQAPNLSTSSGRAEGARAAAGRNRSQRDRVHLTAEDQMSTTATSPDASAASGTGSQLTAENRSVEIEGATLVYRRF